MSHVVILGSKPRSLINFRGELIKEFIRRGHRVTCLAPECSGALRQQIAALGANFIEIELTRTGMNPIADFGFLIRLTLLLRRLKPDCFIAYTIKPVIYGMIAAATAKVPRKAAMITGLGYAFGSDSRRQRFVGKLVRILYRRALASSDSLFFQNPDDRADLVSAGVISEERSYVITNGSGVNLKEYQFSELPLERRVLLLGRIIVDKGVREFVEAARFVKEDFPDACFELAGGIEKGHPRAIPEAELNAWQSDGLVRYLGILEDVRPALRACTVFVLPSYREGTPRTVLEAMAIGRPVVTTDVPGCRETVIPDKTGFLVPAKDSKALAERIGLLLGNREMAVSFGAEGRQFAEFKFDVRKVNERILEELRLPEVTGFEQ